MSKPKKKRVNRKGAVAGGYGFDNGIVAFGNPLEAIGKVAKIREKQREDFQADKAARNSTTDYHRKHG